MLPFHDQSIFATITIIKYGPFITKEPFVAAPKQRHIAIAFHNFAKLHWADISQRIRNKTSVTVSLVLGADFLLRPLVCPRRTLSVSSLVCAAEADSACGNESRVWWNDAAIRSYDIGTMKVRRQGKEGEPREWAATAVLNISRVVRVSRVGSVYAV